MDGISPKVAKQLQAFQCPSCGATITVRAQGLSVTMACLSCKAIVDINNDNYKIIEKAQKAKNKVEYTIPLGARGNLKGILWECIGMMLRCDGTQTYYWKEYLLFNPFHGFRWLVENEGHWNFVTMIKERPDNLMISKNGQRPVFVSIGQRTITYRDDSYKLFLSGEAIVQHVIGEFYWRVRSNDKTAVSDFIAPPYLFSVECSKGEVVCSVGEYIPGSEIRSAFNIKSVFPLPFGVGPNQPSASSQALKSAKPTFFAALAILLVLQFLHVVRFRGESLYSGEFSYSQSDLEKAKISPNFQVPPSAKDISISLYAPVNNSWLAVKGDLVDTSDGQSEEDFEIGVEMYSGYDDGNWSEGSTKANLRLGAVEAGTYNLKVEATAPKQREPYVNPIESIVYTLNVQMNKPHFAGFFIAIFVLALFPIFLFIRHHSNEVARWSNSDYPIGGD